MQVMNVDFTRMSVFGWFLFVIMVMTIPLLFDKLSGHADTIGLRVKFPSRSIISTTMTDSRFIPTIFYLYLKPKGT